MALTTNQYDSLGNLKETSSWVSGSNFLTKSFTYYPDGLPETMTDVNSNITSYGAQDCGPNNKPAFTSTVASGRLTTTTTWDCYGGVPTQFSDANNKNTKYGYDTLWRRTSVTDPLGYVTNTVYTPATATTSATVENYLNFPVNTPTSTVDTLYTLDGLGRFSESEKRTAPGATTFDGAILSTYGWNSKAGTVTGPFSTQTVPGATGVTTTQKDALGRTANVTDGGTGSITYTYSQNDVLSVLGPAAPKENLNQVQSQYDVLGRVTSSCAISGNVTGTVKCGQAVATSPATGVLTSTTYSTTSAGSTTSATRGVQTRSSTTDGIGRVTSSTTPEGGTTTYTYDGAACGSSVTYPGHLIQMNFANGSSQCFEYDSLGRLTRSAGATSSGSAYCKSFLYDNSSGVLGALPPGIPPQYPLGRLVEAETDTCAWPITSSSIITDEWFSYDADGHATDIWELTPHSGGSYYHSTATYAGNGVVTSLVLANPSIATETYGLDGEGRLTSLSSGTHTIVSGVQYNTSSQPPTINVALGTSTDQDTYTYNPKTGRMTNWTFQVGSTPATETGALTWNPNGTLEELAIVDGFNSGGTQNCYYNSGLSPGTGYDDLGRLVGVNCTPSAWSQTFTYDQYDNLTKSGSMAWNPGYDPTTNHYQLAGTSYDLSGNVTNDSSNSYAWDQFNKMASVNSTACGTNGNCATYDAFGRMVEFSKNSIYKENWYTQSGTVVMSGTTLAEAYLVAPGGGTFMELGGQNDYLHKDWLGNARIASLISAQTVGADLAYAPYGEVYNFFSGSGIDWMFTGDLTQLDSEYLWDTPNREFAGKNQGRWLSPDPAGAGWNQYAYATNPMSNVDPSGLVCYPLEKILTGGCGAFMNNWADFGANWDEFYVLNAAYSGSYETPDPSKPWLPMGALDGQIIVGGCTGAPGCQDFEVPQMMTVYPNIGLLNMLSSAGIFYPGQ
ncbi:MAG: RHS repeat-associated core domain-containing protein, partial [Candidatus Sulfotelmatobacter sp.]